MSCVCCGRDHSRTLQVGMREFPRDGAETLTTFDLFVGAPCEDYPGEAGVSMWVDEVNFLVTRDEQDRDVVHKADPSGISSAVRAFNEHGYLAICTTKLYYIQLVRSPRGHISFNWTNSRGFQRGYYEKAYVADLSRFLKRLKWCLLYGTVYRSLALV